MKVAILSGSVYGTAEEVARHAQKLLSAAGFEASHLPRASLDELKAFAPEAFLVVTSTTGMGELPDNLQPLYYAIRDQLPAWHGLPGGVIGLGDSSYGDTFCGGGEQVRELFGELGVRSAADAAPGCQRNRYPRDRRRALAGRVRRRPQGLIPGVPRRGGG